MNELSQITHGWMMTTTAAHTIAHSHARIHIKAHMYEMHFCVFLYFVCCAVCSHVVSIKNCLKHKRKRNGHRNRLMSEGAKSTHTHWERNWFIVKMFWFIIWNDDPVCIVFVFVCFRKISDVVSFGSFQRFFCKSLWDGKRFGILFNWHWSKGLEWIFAFFSGFPIAWHWTRDGWKEREMNVVWHSTWWFIAMKNLALKI